jgi:adenylosuccinate synthase
MSVTVVLGAQWGDEGKGKLADILAHESQICCRAQGGNNAGHTIVANGVTYDFHILPSGLVNPNCINVIGSGCVVHVPSFFKELEALEKHGLNTEGRIYISDRAHVVFDVHQQVDGLEEVELGQGFIGRLKSVVWRREDVLTEDRHHQERHWPNLQHQDDQERSAHVRSLR